MQMRTLLVPFLSRRNLASVIACLIGALTIGLSGCSRSQAPLDNVLRFANGAEPATLDPHLATGVVEHKVIMALFEGLLEYHPTDTFQVIPGVAERWESLEDSKVWRFYLNPNARWSNGDPVTAQDFVYSWQRVLSPALGAQYASILYVIEGAQAFNMGESDDFSTVGVQAIDDHTLEVRLVGPTPIFPHMTMHYAFFPVHPPTIEKMGGMTARATGWTLPGNIVGNGAFILSEWRPSEVLRVRRNPHYWDAETVQLDGVDFFPFESAQSEERAFLAGQLDTTNTVSNSRIPYYRNNRPEVLRIDPFLSNYFYRLNVTRGPLKDVRVRKALSLALNREVITTDIVTAGQTPAGSVTPAMKGYPVVQDPLYDPERARELLAEAGYPGGHGFPRLELLFNTLEDHQRIAEAVQEMWRRELGINIILVNQEWKVYLARQDNLDYDISRAGWVGDFPDPMTFLDMWITESGNNQTGWSNPRFDSLIAQAKRTGNVEERNELMRQAELILLEDQPVIPVYYGTRARLLHPRVQGFAPKLLDNRPWKHIALSEVE